MFLFPYTEHCICLGSLVGPQYGFAQLGNGPDASGDFFYYECAAYVEHERKMTGSPRFGLMVGWTWRSGMSPV